MGEVNIFSAIGGNYMQTVLIIAIFVVMVALMYTKKLSAMFALPVMAFLIALVAGIPLMDRVLEDGTTEAGILNLMFVNGPQRLASSIFMVIYGAILSQIVRQSGIAETVIRKVSELAGDRPLVLGIAFFLVLSVLFVSLGGLGSVMMIGTIVLPIMTSAGLSPLAAGCILLFALSTGGIFNIANWGLYISALGLTVEEIRSFAYFLGAIFVIIGIAFVVIETKRGGKLFRKVKTSNWAVSSSSNREEVKNVPWYVLITPVIPVVLVLAFSIDINTAFVVAILYGFLTTLHKGALNDLTKCVTQGISDSAGAIFLMVGIGQLLLVVMDARVTAFIGPQLSAIMPTHPITYILFFTILAPLALYRGPFNVWGLGLGIGAVMLTTGRLPAMAIMAALMSTGQLQGICDPTNTHNVWTAAATQVDVNDILKKTLPYVWAGAFIGLAVAGFMYL